MSPEWTKRLKNLAVIVAVAIFVSLMAAMPRRDCDQVRTDSISTEVREGWAEVRYQPTETGYVSYRFAAYTVDDRSRLVLIERLVVPGLLGFPGYGEPSYCVRIPTDAMHGQPFTIKMRTTSDRLVPIATINP